MVKDAQNLINLLVHGIQEKSKKMEYMFKDCEAFNQPINHVQDNIWNTSNVTTLAGMFEGCSNFE